MSHPDDEADALTAAQDATHDGATPIADRWREIEDVGLRPSPSAVMWAPLFAQCSAHACHFELRARLYADNTPKLRSVAFKELSVVVAAIVDHVRDRTRDEERAVLEKCVRVRNKLLHLELSRATGQLVSFGASLHGGSVAVADLATGKVALVSRTSTKDGRIFGWLLEASSSGAFVQAQKLFGRGIALVGWLVAKDAQEDCP
jgi:hypothetical protein